MSEEFKIFRGDQDPQEGLGHEPTPAAKKPSPTAPTVTTPVAAVPPAQSPAASIPAPPKPASTASAPPPPPLDFHLDESQLFHTTEAVQQRMAQLASIAHTTAHMLDEQAEEAERIAKRLKSL